MQLHAYLNFGGNCEEAFHFYEQHLGGKVTVLLKHGERVPPGSPPGWEQAVLYARMILGETDIMGNDVPPPRFQPMRSTYLSLTMESADEAERVYALLSAEGEIYMPLQETFFAHHFAMLRDKFGISWMINHPRPMN